MSDNGTFHFAWITELVPSKDKDFIQKKDSFLPVVFYLGENENLYEKYKPNTVIDVSEFLLNEDNLSEVIGLLENSETGYFHIKVNDLTQNHNNGGITDHFEGYFIINNESKVEFLEKEDVDNMMAITLL